MKRLFESLRVMCPASAAVLLFAVQPAAHAWQPSSALRLVGTERVSYADLDLSRKADAEILLARIKKAAYRACGGDPQRHPAYTFLSRRVERAYKDCREDAIARAIDSVDAPVLSLARLQHAGH
ncbi:UrcA family protein [Steroidobacter sp. S1-65]|uniref:UrcA family protein n=1 Tax=Steroidobacter gossypii TaxID=2805490 RepID=A0ABS1WX90_9GAMM|nr:UrcA family protein [Steroidobacter gossypii]MBM0105595.1 UrcA family protein [Steroidobacter gossypii]